MAKREKSFFEKLAERNDAHDQRNKAPKQKTRKKAMWITLGLLGVAVTTAIAVPLAVSVNKVNYNDPVKSESVVLEFSNDSGYKQQITYGELENLIDGDQAKVSEQIEKLYKNVIEFWYKKEVEASKEYQRLWNLSRPTGVAERNDIALQDFETINKTNKGKLEDLKSNFKTQYGYENWQKAFFERLNTDEYGKSSTEEEALTFLNFKQIESEALRHYQVEINSDLTLLDVDRKATKDIIKLDQNGNPIAENGKNVVLYKAGEKVFNWFVAQNGNNNEEANYALSTITKDKVAAITTRSFITSLKSVKDFAQKYFTNNKLIIPTVYKIPGIINSNLETPWKLDDKAKQILKNYSKYTLVSNGDKWEIKSNIDVLKSFKPAQEFLTTNPTTKEEQEKLNSSRSEEQTLLDLLSLDAKNLGTSGIIPFEKQISNNLDLGLSMLDSSIFTNQNTLPSVSLTNLLKLQFNATTEAEINSQLSKIKAEKNKNQASIMLNNLNSYIDKAFDELGDSERSMMLYKQFNKNINIEANGLKTYSFMYNVSDMPDTKLVINTQGTWLVRVAKVQSSQEFFKLFQNDIKAIANGNTSFLDLQNSLNTVFTKNDIIADTLSNQEFRSYISSIKNPSTDKNYTQEDLDKLATNNLSILSGEQGSKINQIFKSLDSWIKEKLKGQSYNFAVVNGLDKIVYKWNPFTTSQQKAIDILWNAIDKEIKGAK